MSMIKMVPLPRVTALLSSIKSHTRIAIISALALLVLTQVGWLYHLDVEWPGGSSYGRVTSGSGSGYGSGSAAPGSPPAAPAVGRFHFVIAASKPTMSFCRTLLSATVTRFGPPVLLGWHGVGDLDAGVTHLAKVRTVLTYLNALPASADDDLFLMVDGYDVYMQFGPEVLIERYHALLEQEDGRIRQQLGPDAAESAAGPLGRHLFFGYDKGCFPDNPRLAACWAGSGPNHHTMLTFGPNTDQAVSAVYNFPRYLNSGTIMGHVREARAAFNATLDLIDRTYDAADKDTERDQYYMGQLWGLQEYDRIRHQRALAPDEPVHRGPPDAVVPDLDPARSYNLHMALDYDGSLFQPWAANARWVTWRRFSGPQFSYLVEDDVEEHKHYRPWQFHLPGDGLAQLHRIWNTTADDGAIWNTTADDAAADDHAHDHAHDDKVQLGRPNFPHSTRDLVHGASFGSSFVTRTVFGMWHCTLAKSDLEKFWPMMWFVPYGRVLVRSAIAWFRRDGDAGAGTGGPPAGPYTAKKIAGRIWYPAWNYPADAPPDDGGAWSDTSNENGTVAWLPWSDMCAEFEHDVFVTPSSPPAGKAQPGSPPRPPAPAPPAPAPALSSQKTEISSAPSPAGTTTVAGEEVKSQTKPV